MQDTRGRRVLTRRQLLRVTGGVAAGAVVAAGGYLAVRGNSQRARLSAHSTALVDRPGRLVGYTGEQPIGFQIAKIPAGMFVDSSSDRYALVLVPENESASGGPPGVQILENRLAVGLQSGGRRFNRGRRVTVNGRRGFIDGQDGARLLSFRYGSQVGFVQCWPNIALTDAQLISFAEGITFTSAARGRPW